MFLLAFFADKVFGTGTKKLRGWVVIVAVVCGMASLILVQGIPAFGVPAVLGGIFSWPWMPFISMTTTIAMALLINAIVNLFAAKK
jgi:SSS family solute:Na+ symporter